LLYLCLLLIPFGLTLTFSRAALIGIFSGFISYLLILGWKRSINLRTILPIITLIIGFSSAFLMLRPYINTRETLSDQGVNLRSLYNQIGIKMLSNRPIQGFGLGTSMLHMERFSPRSLETWEIQPIHNYYLLTFVELGAIGGLALLYLIFTPFLKLLKKLWQNRGEMVGNRLYYRTTLISIFVSFTVLMLFDHYFYTLQQTQLLLWLVIGLIAAENKS
jgi:O-antigen ligase